MLIDRLVQQLQAFEHLGLSRDGLLRNKMKRAAQPSGKLLQGLILLHLGKFLLADIGQHCTPVRLNIASSQSQ